MKSILFLSIYMAIIAHADSVVPIEKIIKERKPYYDFNGSSPLEVIKKDVDFIKQSGVILSKEREKSITGKKTPEELRASLAVYKHGKRSTIDELVKEKLKEPKETHYFEVIKKSAPKPKPYASKKTTILNKLYYGDQ